MILMPLGESDLRSLAFHFASQEDELVTACRRLILELSSQLWFWFELPYADWLYKLLIGNVVLVIAASTITWASMSSVKHLIKLLILPGATMS